MGWRTLAVAAGAASLLWAAVPSMATDTSVAVTGGCLNVSAPAVADFATVTLDGSAQVTEVPFATFAVTDARGTGEGWRLALQATPFREWNVSDYVVGGKALTSGSLSLPGLSVAADGTDSSPPVMIAGPHALDPAAVTLARAGVGTGMGRFVFRATGALRVEIPGSAYAGTYRAELSLSVTSGP